MTKKTKETPEKVYKELKEADSALPLYRRQPRQHVFAQVLERSVAA